LFLISKSFEDGEGCREEKTGREDPKEKEGRGVVKVLKAALSRRTPNNKKDGFGRLGPLHELGTGGKGGG